MASSTPQVLLLQPKSGMQAEMLEDLYKPLFSRIEKRYRTNKVDFTCATDLFANDQPSIVLAVDGVLSARKYRALHEQLARYVKEGGTVILCCLFSNSCPPKDMCRLFATFGLKWQDGDYHRTTFALNQAFEPVFGSRLHGTLESSYCVKALHVKHVPYNSRVYSPTSESKTQSHVFPATSVDQAQSPAVLTKCGRGFLGYIGDVNNESGSQALLMAMIETAIKVRDSNTALTTSNESQNQDHADSNLGCFVCGKLEPVKNCSACKKVQYCSPACQKRAWKVHKEVCNKPNYVSEEEIDEEEDEDEDDDGW